ncbi:MAG TPA: hypothetical protein VFP23_00975 [Solirubrobacterales bacterium]|nr:hypothetical protein [Solirubrobacterales bacterium]
MVERLRALAESPLDPGAARAVVVLSAAIFAGLAVLVALAGSEQANAPRAEQAPAARPAPPAPFTPLSPPRTASPAKPRAARTRRRPAQDPQDRRGSAAARRAARELADHRALQHVPYRKGAVAIALAGAAGPRAILAVSAPTLAAAKLGWRTFLRRYRDSGRSYLPRFQVRRGRRG